MKNDIGQRLNEELQGVRLSDDRRRRILSEVYHRRTDPKKSLSSLGSLALAAAAVVVIALAAGFAALRTEHPDLNTTPMIGGPGANACEVWINDADGLYHADSSCDNSEDAHCVKLKTARAEGRKACAACIDETSEAGRDLMWMTAQGEYYHARKNCSGMIDAFGVLELEALTLGRQACPVCIAPKEGEAPEPEETADFVPNTPAPTATAVEETLTPAEITPTPEMNGDGVEEQGVEHSAAEVAGITEALTTFNVDAAELPETTSEPTAGAESELPEVRDLPTEAPADEAAVGIAEELAYVWATPGGLYFHQTSDCSGMKEAARMAGAEACLKGKKPCPTCFERLGSSEVVWVAPKGGYYHFEYSCPDLGGNLAISTVEIAMAGGLEPCPLCADIQEDQIVWMTPNGVYYHAFDDCSGMLNASEVYIKEAELRGKEACPVCMTRTFWISKTGGEVICHRARNCMGMTDADAEETVLAPGVMLDIDRCKMCFSSIPVWMSRDGKYYHWDEHCSGMTGALQVSEIEAHEAGARACPICMAGLNTTGGAVDTKFDSEIAG